MPQPPFNPPTYVCYKAPAPIKIDGKLSPGEWDAIPWTTDFVDIEGDKRPAPHFQTRAKMTYDDNGMYFAVLMEEPHVWATITEHDAVIFHDNDFEIFLNPTNDTHNYLEYEVNALGTEWDLFLTRPYRDNPQVLNNWEFAGMKSAVYVDGTLGRAGHSREIAKRLTTGRLICIDRDQAAIDAARERLAPWLERVTLVHSNFDRVSEILAELDIPGVDGMLFDLGVSSPQLDDASRGFSYMHDAPLDMRMDATAPLTAYDVVNTWSYEELRRILFEYGEERYAPAIAKRIVQARETAPVQTTLELAELIRSAMPAAALREKQHPAKRSFQAIRIAVNGELDALPPMLSGAIDHLNPGGRLAVITFHSLEDRIVKRAFQDAAKGCTCPPEFPVCVCGKKPRVRLVTRKPIVSGAAELEENSRARSAKLRVVEKCDPFDI